MLLASHSRLAAAGRTVARRSLSALAGKTSVASLSNRSIMSIDDLSTDELSGLIDAAANLKAMYKGNQRTRTLDGKTLAMIFQKRSTRTRVSTETGMANLGGNALFLGPQDVHIGVNESISDTAKVLSGFNSMIMARVYEHSDVTTLRDEASVPVLNALSDLHHPLQTLADLLTLREHFGDIRGKTLAWVGDGNNIIHCLGLGCAKLGLNLKVACPTGYEPDQAVWARTKTLAATSGAQLVLTTDPVEAVAGSNVVVTDTWISMGEEGEAERKLKDFAGYQVDASMMAKADTDAVFLHCLPRHPEEVTDEVLYGPQSLIFQAAENRMWTVMAVLNSVLQ